MARRRLAPSWFTAVGGKSRVPMRALLVTGGLLLGLVASLPVFELAKLASAFQLLVFALINVAYVAFRSTKLWWYRPKFRAPGYPVVPIAGALACLGLITQLGLDAILGALGIVIAGLVWYQVYGRSRALKESAFRESVRQQGMSRVLQSTRDALAYDARRVALVVPEGRHDQWLSRLADRVTGSAPERGEVRRFSPDGNLNRSLREYAPDLVVSPPLGDDDFTDHHLPAEMDVALVSSDHLDRVDTIAVLGSGGPYDVLKMSTAVEIAEAEGASLRFVHVLDPSASRAQVRSLERFHSDLDELCEVPTESMVVESEDLISALTDAVEDADLAVIGSSRGHHLFSDLIDGIIDTMSIPVLLVRVADRDRRLSIRGFVDRFLVQALSRGRAERS